MAQHNELIERLPTEIWHKIFDYIDSETILLSIRLVCRQGMALTATYNRYTLHFDSISKQNFTHICHLIQPENIISLTFANDDRQANQIDLFLSLIDTQRLTRIHTLKFLGVDEINFQNFMNCIKLDSLQTFAIEILKYDRRRLRTSTRILTRILSQVSMHILDLNIPNAYWNNLTWPAHCSIKELKVHHSISFHYLCEILKYSSQLETLTLSISLQRLLSTVTLNSTLTPLFKQLTSLTIELCDTDIDTVESLVKLMPSLVHFKICNKSCDSNFLNGYRWEKLIEKNLFHLKKFEFFFVHRFNNEVTSNHMEHLITPYRSLFWRDTKRWLVFIEHVIHDPTLIRLFTTPIDRKHHEYDKYPRKTYLSNVAEKEKSHMLIMRTVSIFKLVFNNETASYFKQEV